MKTVSIAAALLGGVMTLSACSKSAPAQDVGQMSVSDMEAALADGQTPDNADQMKLRLAGIYAKYGSESQRASGLSYIGDLAERGNKEAVAMHCREPYLTQGMPASVLYCIKAAQDGSPKAQGVMCQEFYAVKDRSAARKMCQSAADSGVNSAFLPLGIMFAKGEGGQAFPYKAIPYLERAIEEGRIDQRDKAVAQLRAIPEAEKYQYKSDAALGRTPSNEKAAIATVTVQPKTPRNLRQNGQCRLVYEITPTGVLFNMNIDCSDASLVDPVLEAAHQWRFTPRTVLGVPAYTRRQSTVIPFKVQ